MATYIKTIICLANSSKHGGRCVAGKVITPQGIGDWLRPIGSASQGAVSYKDRQYSGGAEPVVLDVIAIPLTSKASHQYQPENHFIDANQYWQLVRKATPQELLGALDPPQRDLWGTGESSGSGINDRVMENTAPGFGYSLRLIRVNDLEIRVSVENPSFTSKKTVRGYFTYSRTRYALGITDPLITSKFTSQGNGTYSVNDAVLCVSLGEPFNGHAYKLIAGVFLP